MSKDPIVFDFTEGNAYPGKVVRKTVEGLPPSVFAPKPKPRNSRLEKVVLTGVFLLGLTFWLIGLWLLTGVTVWS